MFIDFVAFFVFSSGAGTLVFHMRIGMVGIIPTMMVVN